MSSLKKNFLYQAVYQVLIILLPLLTAPYVARVLGVANAGIYSYSHNVANYFVVFAMLGLEQYGARCIAQVRNSYEEMSKTFSELLLLHAFVSIAAIAVYFFYCMEVCEKYTNIFLLQSFFVISSLFDVNWFFFGIEKFKLTVVRNTVIKILSVVCIFLFVKSREDLPVYTFILSFSVLLTQIIIWPILQKYVSFKRVPLASLKKHCQPLLILFIAVLAANLNRMINKVMLGWFDKIIDLGCYDYADKIARIPLSFIAAIDTVMLSKMSNLFAQKQQKAASELLDASACLVLLFSFGMCAWIAAIAPEFVVWFLGRDFAETAYLLGILALTIPIVGWNNYIRTQILIPNQMDQVYSRAICIGAVVNIFLNFFIIRIMGARGAAAVTVVSYTVIMLLQTIPVLYVMPVLKNYFHYALFPLFAGLVMYGTVRLCSGLSNHLFATICIELLVGSVVYIGLSLIYLNWKKPLILKAILRK